MCPPSPTISMTVKRWAGATMFLLGEMPPGCGIAAPCPSSPALLLPQGCFDQILEDIKTNADVVGGVAAGIAALEVSALSSRVGVHLGCRGAGAAPTGHHLPQGGYEPSSPGKPSSFSLRVPGGGHYWAASVPGGDTRGSDSLFAPPDRSHGRLHVPVLPPGPEVTPGSSGKPCPPPPCAGVLLTAAPLSGPDAGRCTVTLELF